MTQRDQMHYDVVIVGAGPAGLAAAIRLKQLAAKKSQELSVCVLEKGADLGAHILSGAVIDPVALDELIPDWKNKNAPITTQVKEDQFLWLTEKTHFNIPAALLPPLMNNHGNYIVSLGQVCRWLGSQAEELGVDLFPGFNGSDMIYGEDGSVKGVITGDMGIARDGSQKNTFSAGIELHARYTLIAEGTRGSLAKSLEQKFNLRANTEPQKYGLGFKEIWSIDPAHHNEGAVLHTQGWPLDNRTGGGGFLYHLADNKIALGFVVHLNFQNPYLNPFEEFQRFKTHPAIKPLLENAKRLSYGARTINEGGIQSLPELIFPGGAFIGCSAGFVNVPKIKGSHNAMKSGMLAADAIIDAFAQEQYEPLLKSYPEKIRASWLWKDLYAVRNIKPALSAWGNFAGTLYAGIDLWLHSLGFTLPWTLKHGKADHECLIAANKVKTIHYPAADGKITFDRLSSIYLANITHDEDQPVHLQLTNQQIPIDYNLSIYDAPEQRYCPAGVYEIVKKGATNSLHINAANCIHCKACDIKDPTQNIRWVPPQGGSGPYYDAM
ncbi:electron transfer flavoprotein-ubiquinone oxidoreductase [Cellvibrio sp. UBA7661]|uniref:electron transfer flavoprotein-ubiquinone oxidoreductase n=1 Tax=Cellvibrio sp. UBA7661 TaxID=1946311 RepID=UPI002F35008E